MKPGEIPNVLGQINQIFTPEEQRALLQEAMEACKNFQKTQFGKNMTDSNRQNFIRKYINQKALKKIQNMRLAQMAANGTSQRPQQRQEALSQMQQTHSRSASAGVMPNGGQFNGNTNNPQATMSQPVSGQQMNRASQTPQQPPQQPPQQQPQQPAQQGKMQQPRPNVLQAFAPTPQDVETVKRISVEAARTPLRLSDLTNTLSPQEKEEIKRKLQVNQQLFAQVSNYAPHVYVLTKSENFLKEVLQLRIFVKEILEKCTKGVFVVKLDTVDKLVLKYQKYWESMKIQLLRRQQLIQQQQQQQQQLNQDPVGPSISQQQQRVQGSLQQIQQQMQQKQRQQQQRSAPNSSSSMATPNPAAIAAASAMSNGNNYAASSYQQAMTESNGGAGPQSNLAGSDPKSGGHNLGYMASDTTKPSPSQGISPQRDFAKVAAANHSRIKSSSTKLSPTNIGQSGINTPSVAAPALVHSRSATPAAAGTAGSPMGTKNGAPFQKTPSPLTVPSMSRQTPSTENRPYKQEENNLRNLNIRKAEIISRFKHRQELFHNSPVDMFLSTLADCIGVKDDQVDIVTHVPQATIDQINGTGKKKLTKATQRVRDQDVVTLAFKGNKLVMESKTSPATRSYRIRPNALASVFRNVYGTTDISDMNFNDTTPRANPSSAQLASRKRKLDENGISPVDSATSHSSSLMGESKKIKIDSPEDLFAGKDTTKSHATSVSLSNIWDWNYWRNQE